MSEEDDALFREEITRRRKEQAPLGRRSRVQWTPPKDDLEVFFRQRQKNFGTMLEASVRRVRDAHKARRDDQEIYEYRKGDR
jgi:hypothetical protein